MRTFWVLCAAATVAVLLLPAGRPLAAAQDGATAIAQRINLAGRQRMLTQRMTKAACLSIVGVNPQFYAEQAYVASVEFDIRLSALISGDDELQLAPEKDADVVRLLREVEALATQLTPSIRQLASGHLHSVVVQLILDSNLPTFHGMNNAVNMMRRPQDDVIDMRTQNTIDEVGRQRMLSQKIAKNACLIAGGLSTPRTRVVLNKDMADLGNALAIFVSTQVPDQFEQAPNYQVKAELRRANEVWRELKPLLRHAVSGRDIPAEMLEEIGHKSDQILQSVDDAVKLWVMHYQ